MSDDSRKPSAVTLIRAQGEQIRRMLSAEEYLKDKIGSDDADESGKAEQTQTE